MQSDLETVVSVTFLEHVASVFSFLCSEKTNTCKQFLKTFSFSGWAIAPFDFTLHLAWADFPCMITGRLRVMLRMVRFDFIAFFSKSHTDGGYLLMYLQMPIWVQFSKLASCNTCHSTLFDTLPRKTLSDQPNCSLTLHVIYTQDKDRLLEFLGTFKAQQAHVFFRLLISFTYL